LTNNLILIIGRFKGGVSKVFIKNLQKIARETKKANKIEASHVPLSLQ
jgi:hypothetical protein